MKTLILFLMCNIAFSQSSIVAAGNATETFGETFPIMQNAQKEVTLSVPKYEMPIEPPKPIVKKQSLWQKIILIIKKLFR